MQLGKFLILEAGLSPVESSGRSPEVFRREVRGRPKAPFRAVYLQYYILLRKIMRFPSVDYRSCTSDEHAKNFSEDHRDVDEIKSLLQLDFFIMPMPFLLRRFRRNKHSAVLLLMRLQYCLQNKTFLTT